MPGSPRSARYSVKMLARLRGSGRTSGATEKLSPTACPGVGYGILADDQHPHAVERKGEGAQHVRTGWQIPVAGGELGAQELPHRGDLGFDRCSARAQPASTNSLSGRAVTTGQHSVAASVRTTASPRLPLHAAPSTSTARSSPASNTVPIERQPAGGAPGNVATSAWSSPPPEHPLPRVGTPPRRPPRPPHRRSAASPAADTSMPTPDAVGDVAQVGEQPVGDVGHRGRAGLGRDPPLTVRRLGHQVAAPQVVESVDPVVPQRVSGRRPAEITGHRHGVTRAWHRCGAPARGHRDRRAPSPRSPTAGPLHQVTADDARPQQPRLVPHSVGRGRPPVRPAVSPGAPNADHERRGAARPSPRYRRHSARWLCGRRRAASTSPAGNAGLRPACRCDTTRAPVGGRDHGRVVAGAEHDDRRLTPPRHQPVDNGELTQPPPASRPGDRPPCPVLSPSHRHPGGSFVP